MNDNERTLLGYVCKGDIKNAQQHAKIILSGMKSEKDRYFCEKLLRTLDNKPNVIELPPNLREILIAEEISNFPENRYLLRDSEKEVVQKISAMLKAAERLSEMGITYYPAVMLYGASGGGKTMLAKYIAYKTNRPFVYVRFSSIVSCTLGSTQTNVARVFDYARTAPCVLCFDEIDALGMARGQKDDVGEMSRVVIALMQEMDRLSNNVIVIGTTNRYDCLDTALVRRFTLKHKVELLNCQEIKTLAGKFFNYAGVVANTWLSDFCCAQFSIEESAATVIEKCTNKIVQTLTDEDRINA